MLNAFTDDDKTKLAASITEAPEDGSQYARKDASWVTVAGSVSRYALNFTKNANLSQGSFLVFGEVTTSETVGYVMPVGATLEGVAIGRSDSDAADIEILQNGAVVATVATASTSVVDTSMSVALSTGDVISARNKSGSATMSNVIATLVLEG